MSFLSLEQRLLTLTQIRHFSQCTLWLRPCLSNRDIIDVMCSSLIMFRASGLSTNTQ